MLGTTSYSPQLSYYVTKLLSHFTIPIYPKQACTSKYRATTQIATASSERLQIQPHWGWWVKCIHVHYRSNRVLFLLWSKRAIYIGPLRLGVTTPTKALPCHASANDQTSPSVLAPHLQWPEYPIHECWVRWLIQYEWIHQNRVSPPSRQPTRYQQVTLVCTMHTLFVVIYIF